MTHSFHREPNSGVQKIPLHILLVRIFSLSILFFILCPSQSYGKEVVKMLTITPNSFAGKIYFAQVEKDFEAQHPDIDIVIRYLNDASFKKILPTLLATDSQPDLFYSWGGGVFREQIEMGQLQDISLAVQKTWGENFSPTNIDAFSQNGKIYGGPLYATEVIFWYNKELTEKAGIDAQQIRTWSDFLIAVTKLKEAHITPIIVGGGDLWPLQLYWGSLALRIAGSNVMKEFHNTKGPSFINPSFLKTSQAFLDLAKLKPFQKDFKYHSYQQAARLFGDGEGAFHLMGNWDYETQKVQSTTQKGIADINLGILPFPMVEGGAGLPTDTYGGINGFLVTKNATKATSLWLENLLSKRNQIDGARRRLWIPVAKDTEQYLENSFYRQISKRLSTSTYHQIFLDQALGTEVGTAINKVSAKLALGTITAREATKEIQQVWLKQQKPDEYRYP